MQMQIRIKASDKFEDRFALEMSGGEHIGDKFIFQNEAQRIEYDRIRRRLNREGEDGISTIGDSKARKFERKHSYPRKHGS